MVAIPPLESQDLTITLNNATVAWLQDRAGESNAPSAASTLRHKFVLIDLTLKFLVGEMSLSCGRVCAHIHNGMNDNADTILGKI